MLQSALQDPDLLDTNQMLAQAEQVSDDISVTAQQLVKLLKRNLVFYRAEDGTLSKLRSLADGEQTEKVFTRQTMNRRWRHGYLKQ